MRRTSPDKTMRCRVLSTMPITANRSPFDDEIAAVLARLGAMGLAHFATAWVLANRAVSSVIAGPRTLARWQDYHASLDCVITPEDEALVDSLVSPGHPSTPGYNDPVCPLYPRN